MAKTHMAFANTITLAPIALLQQTQIYSIENIYYLPIIIIGVTFGSLLPDIDEKNSTISRMSLVTALFSWYLKYMGTEHRGFTHKFFFFLFFAAIAIASYFTASKEIFLLLCSLAYGVLAHHLGDMMVGGGKNKGGIYNYFWPFYTKNDTTKFLPYFMRCQINGIKEYFYFLVFTTINLYTLYLLSPLNLNKNQILNTLGL